MSRRHYLVEENEGYEDDGRYVKTIVWTPMVQSEAKLVKTAMEMRSVAQSHATLLAHYAKAGIQVSLPKPRLLDFDD